jgi:hypothetical protein
MSAYSHKRTSSFIHSAEGSSFVNLARRAVISLGLRYSIGYFCRDCVSVTTYIH